MPSRLVVYILEQIKGNMMYLSCSVGFRASYRFVLLVALCGVAGLSGCANRPQKNATSETLDDEWATEQTVKNPDPLEKYNRAIFSFNLTLDRWLMKPVAKSYQWILPNPVERGVSNFFDNLGEVSNILNDVLQWKWRQAMNDSGRLLMNSTLGVAGFFDVASKVGLEESDGEDFGQTLAAWGVPRGPYIVVPFLGPYTLREGTGYPVDWFSNPVTYLESQAAQNSLTALNFVQLRASLLATEALASGDFYLFVRDAYLQRRDYLVNDGVVEDDFGDDMDFDDF